MKKKVPTEQEIVKKHGVSLDYVTRQAEVGSTVEREHVTTHEEAYGIALQHIMEFPDYYKHLLPMEKKLKKEWEGKNKKMKEGYALDLLQKVLVEHCGCEEPMKEKDGISDKCTKTPSGTYCPQHGKKACPGVKLSEAGDWWHPDPQKDRQLGGPGAKLRHREDGPQVTKKPKDNPRKLRPGESYMDFAKRMARNESAAWQRKEGKNKNGGLNEKGRKSYESENPGSDLKAPQPEGGPRKDSFCARMRGMKKKLTSKKTANDPDSRINKSLRAWKC